jgi:hypothetical protein
MLVAALETEVAAYLEAHREERDEERYALVQRQGAAWKITVAEVPPAAGIGSSCSASLLVPGLDRFSLFNRHDYRHQQEVASSEAGTGTSRATLLHEWLTTTPSGSVTWHRFDGDCLDEVALELSPA